MTTKRKIIYVCLGLFLLFAGCSGYRGYNRLVDKEEAKNEKWSQVQSQYQRRADLIPNIVDAVENVARFEKGTLEAVTQARASATKVTIDPSNLTPEKMAQFENAQATIGSSLSRLLVSVERYPELKSNQQFSELIAELSGTENRIQLARRHFNESVLDYNKGMRKFPSVIWAKMFSFQQSAYFEADSKAQSAPKVHMHIN